MKGDIIVKIVISVLIPVFILYAFFLAVKYSDYGITIMFNSIIYLAFAYLLFFFRFERAKMKDFAFLRFVFIALLMVFLLFILNFLFILLNIKIW